MKEYNLADEVRVTDTLSSFYAKTGTVVRIGQATVGLGPAYRVRLWPSAEEKIFYACEISPKV